MNLRPYQQRAVQSVLDAYRDGAQRVCLVLPTGAGKTVTAHAVAELLGGKALWLVHRSELAAQAPGEAVTIQSLLASGSRPDCDVLIADECHHLAPGAEQWHTVARHYPRILGLTATPQRGDGTALGDLFDGLVVGAHYSELLQGGWLVPCKTFRPAEEIQGVAQKPSEAWQAMAGDRRGFAFFSKVEFAQKFAAEVQGAEAVWGDMSAADRYAAIQRFRKRATTCLANVQLLTEGFDVPEAEVCLLATGCDHAGAYLQRVGRVLRPAAGKNSALLIDLTGASHRFGLPTDDREYSLSGRPIKSKTESLRVCQQCGRTYPSADGACPECGFLPPAPPRRLRVLGMTLQEVIDSADATSKQRTIAAAIARKWGGADRSELADEYRRLAAIGVARGYKPGWAAYQFKLRTGRWPDRSMRNG